MSDRTWFWRATFESKDDPETVVRIRGGVEHFPDGYDAEAVEDYIKDRIWEEYGVQNSQCIVHVELDNEPGDEL